MTNLKQLAGHGHLEGVSGEVDPPTGCQAGLGPGKAPTEAGTQPAAVLSQPQAHTYFTQEVSLYAH